MLWWVAVLYFLVLLRILHYIIWDKGLLGIAIIMAAVADAASAVGVRVEWSHGTSTRVCNILWLWRRRDVRQRR